MKLSSDVIGALREAATGTLIDVDFAAEDGVLFGIGIFLYQCENCVSGRLCKQLTLVCRPLGRLRPRLRKPMLDELQRRKLCSEHRPCRYQRHRGFAKYFRPSPIAAAQNKLPSTKFTCFATASCRRGPSKVVPLVCDFSSLRHSDSHTFPIDSVSQASETNVHSTESGGSAAAHCIRAAT